ncbi:UBN2_3 domain-containing protein [Cucumis melo var. makuwa]|uniref:UBN2_3 domain-containing protein n=1 Tax=Cucumis melo var. makuwa TaxID=1194695 RepID=A0A5D3BZC4_CUCMM|nr:UBN2_3 domain-containing protein [Cucumis melo var. makuwa]TYK04470.1 UBN2_3 domain-containing protein [Cucumis melo var. makuwa]
MVSERGKYESLDTGIRQTQIEAAAAIDAIIAAAMENLLHQLQKLSAIKMDLPSESTRKQVHDCKQGTLDIASYFNKLSLLWQEMDLCRETIWDTSNDDIQCARLEVDRVYDFLAGLNPKHTKDQCWKLHGCPLRGKKRSSNDKQNLGHAYVSESASTTQPSGLTVNQNDSPSTLGAFAQSSMPLSLSFISFDGKNSWILDLGPTNHLTGSCENFVSYIFHVLDLSSGRRIGTTRHSRGLYILDDDTSDSSISGTSLLSSYFIIFEQDCQISSGILPFTIIRLQGKSVSEMSNCTLESIEPEPTPSILPDPDPHPIVLPQTTTNQVPWKTYYRRNLRKEIESPTNQLAPVQDSEPPRDQGMTNTIESCVDSKMSENDRSDVIVPEDMGENDSGDRIEVRA